MNLGYLRIIALLACLLPGMVSADPIEIPSHLRMPIMDGTELERQKRLVRDNPGSQSERITLSEIYYFHKLYENSEKEAHKGIKLGAESYIARSLLAHSKLQLKKVVDAKRIIKKLEPSSSSEMADRDFLLGYASELDNSFKRADEYYEKSVENSFNPQALLGRARIALASKNYEQVSIFIKDIESAFSSNRDYVEFGELRSVEKQRLAREIFKDLLLIRSKLLVLDRDYKKAVRSFDDVLTFDSHNMEAKLGKIKSQISIQDYKQAEDSIEDLISIYGFQPAVLFLRAVLYVHQNKFFDAAIDAEQVLLAVPNHYPSIYISGLSYFKQGNFEQSASKLSRYVQRSRSHKNARLMLAASYHRLNSPQKTISTLKEYLNGDVEDLAVLILAGNAYMQLGHIEKGEAFVNQALQMVPRESGLARELAVIELLGSGKDSHLKAFHQITHDPELERLLIYGMINRGEYLQAEKLILNKRKKEPENIAYQMLAGDLEQARGNFQGAVEIYTDVLRTEFLNAEALIKRARVNELLGFLDAAESDLNKVLDIRANHLTALLQIYNLKINAGDRVAAYEILKDLRQTYPKNYEIARQMVDYYLLQSKDKEALAEAKRYYRQHPDSIDSSYLYIEVLNKLGFYNEAELTLYTLIDKEPDRVSHKIYLSELALSEKKYSKVESILNQVLKTEPKNIPSLVLMSNLFLQKKYYEKAKELMEKAITVSPDNPHVLKLKGDYFWSVGKFGQAIKDYEKAYTVIKDSDLVYRLSKSYENHKGYETALVFLNKHLKSQYKDVTSELMLGELHMRHNAFEDALASYRRIYAVSADNPIVINNIAILFHKIGDKRALEYARKAYEIEPELPEILDTLGWILVSEGDKYEGVELLGKAFKLLPKDKLIRYHYAIGLTKIGSSKAKDIAKKLLITLLSDKELGSVSNEALMAM